MSGDIVFITGANTGLGLETAKALYASPTSYQILVGSRDLGKAKAAINSLQQSASNSKSTLDSVQVDLADDASIVSAFDHIKSKYGRVDVLINNAGTQVDAQLASGSLALREGWNQNLNVNVSGTQYLTSTFIPLLLASTSPRLIFITSGLSSLIEAGDQSHPRYSNPPKGWPKADASLGYVSYRSSKAALNMAMIQWDRVLKNDGVKVWCVSPGMLATGLGGDPEKLKAMGAIPPSVGANVVKDVVEGKRDADVGKVVKGEGVVQPF